MKAFRLPILAGLFLLVVACAGNQPQPLIPQVDYKTDYDFSALTSFSLLSRRLPTGAGNLMSDMAMQRADLAFKQALENRGLRYEEKAADADILVSWLLVTEERTDIRGYNATANYQCWGCGPAISDMRVTQYTQGTLIVDLIDPTANQSIWRSLVQSRLRNGPQLEGQQERFNQVAETMLEGFPPL